MFDLRAFTGADMVECRVGLRRVASTATSLEQAADGVVRYLRDHLVDKSTGHPSCPLVRYYQTQPYDGSSPTCRRSWPAPSAARPRGSRRPSGA